MKELQIVNHNEFYPILGMHPARLGPQLQNGQPRRVINIQRRLVKLAGSLGDPLEIVGIEQTVPKVLKFSRALEQIIRVTSDSAVISKLNTPTGTFSLSVTCSTMFMAREVFPWMAAQR